MVSDENNISFCSYVNFTLPVVLSYFVNTLCGSLYCSIMGSTEINTFGT